MTVTIQAVDPAPLLARLPGWASADCTPMGHGSNNAVFLLNRGDERAVLKVAVSARGFPHTSRQEEALAQRRAHAAGLAPEVLHADDDVVLEEYIDAPACDASDLQQEAMLRRLATALRRLHALPPVGRRFPLQTSAQFYRDGLPPGADHEQAEYCLSLVAAVDRNGPLCFSHNDLVAGNILDGDRLCFIDWEYAGDNDPLFDLATLVAHHHIDNEGAGILLEAYFGERWRDHADAMRRMCEAYAALAWLWEAFRPSCTTLSAECP